MDGVRGADADDVQMFFLDHLRNVRVGVDIVSLCEGFCTLQISVTHGSELAVLQLGVCLCMEISTFPQPMIPVFNFIVFSFS